MSEINPFTPQREKNIHAQALGKLGGEKGGRARSDKLSPERKKEIAAMGGKARWSKNV